MKRRNARKIKERNILKFNLKNSNVLLAGFIVSGTTSLDFIKNIIPKRRILIVADKPVINICTNHF